MQLGHRIRTLRKRRGRSLAATAAASGVTESFLSRLERGQTGVTVANLRQIAASLGVELVDLLQDEASPAPLVLRAGHAPAMIAESTGGLQARPEMLIPRSGADLQATLYRTPKGGGRREPFSHPGEEFAFVVSGTVTYIVRGEEFELAVGDSIWHASSDPHHWQARSTDAVTLHVNTPPVW